VNSSIDNDQHSYHDHIATSTTNDTIYGAGDIENQQIYQHHSDKSSPLPSPSFFSSNKIFPTS